MLGNFANSIFSRTPISLLFQGRFEDFLLAVLYLLPALVIALAFHEAAHAWMADRMGDPTARNLGRVTLDPTKHIDLFGFISFLFIGFGWGKPVPINQRNFHNYKKANILVSLSGVTMNLMLSFVFYLITFLLYYVFGVTNIIVLRILLNIIDMNIILCFFNLIPIPPLDGHHLISGFIARRSPKFYMMYMRYGQIVLLMLLFLTDVIQIALSFLSNGVWTLYNLLFGLFI